MYSIPSVSSRKMKWVFDARPHPSPLARGEGKTAPAAALTDVADGSGSRFQFWIGRGRRHLKPEGMICAFLMVLLCALNVLGADIDDMGGTLLHQVDTTLQGNGVVVAQPEADNGGVSGQFEVNPSVVNQPVSLFTWISSSGT